LQHSVRDAVHQDISRQKGKGRSYIANADAAWWTQPLHTQQHVTTYERRLPRTFRTLPSDLNVPKRTASVATLMNESDIRQPAGSTTARERCPDSPIWEHPRPATRLAAVRIHRW
jgi:hypothetical protein